MMKGVICSTGDMLTKHMFPLGFPLICEVYLVLAPSKAPPKPGVSGMVSCSRKENLA